MAKSVSDVPTLPPDPCVLVAESAMTKEAKQALALLLLEDPGHPAGVECLPRVLAASRGFSSNVASREALPRILAYWLSGSHSSWALPFRFVLLPHATLIKALRYDPDEIEMANLMPGYCTRVWSNTYKYHAQLAGLQALSSMMLPVDGIMNSLVDLPSAPVISGFPNQCILHSASSTLADPRASKNYPPTYKFTTCISHVAYILSRTKKELDTLNAGTQECDGTMNLNVARTTGDTIMKHNGLFSEHLNTVNLSENNEFNSSSIDHTWFGLPSKEEDIHRNIATFFVKVEGTSISVHQNLSTTTTKMLVEHACVMKGIWNYDGYAVYHGVVLDENKLLSGYKICNNCTVEIRGRVRAGRETKERRIKCTTFDDEITGVNLFSVVPLPKTLTNISTNKNRATFLSRKARWIARQVLISLCRMHFRGKCLDGTFNSTHILFHDGRVIFDESCMEDEFSEDRCKNNYLVIAEIFGTWFLIPGEEKEYPLFVEDLIDYLSTCPLGVNSDSVEAIAFLINHPALTAFTDRMAQCSTLDTMVDRLTVDEKQNFVQAIGLSYSWGKRAQEVHSMFDTLAYNPRENDADTEAAPHADKNSDEEKSLYTEDPRSCLKFSRNYFKHARIDLFLERVEAAFSLNFEEFLPKILRAIVQDFKGPPTFDIVTLLGDHVADMKRKKDVQKDSPAAEVIAPPAKRSKVSFAITRKSTPRF